MFLGLTDCGKQLAGKRIKLRPGSMQDAYIKSFEREEHMLQKMQHPSVVKYIASQRLSSCEAVIWMEYVAGGSIASLLQTFGPLDQMCVAEFTRQVATCAHATQRRPMA